MKGSPVPMLLGIFAVVFLAVELSENPRDAPPAKVWLDAGTPTTEVRSDGGSPWFSDGYLGGPTRSSREQHPDDLNVWAAQVTFGAEPSPYYSSTGLPPPPVGPLDAGNGWKRHTRTYTVSAWIYERNDEDQIRAQRFIDCAAIRGFDRAVKNDCGGVP